MQNETILFGLHAYSSGLCPLRIDCRTEYSEWLVKCLGEGWVKGWLTKVRYCDDGTAVEATFSTRGVRALAAFRRRMSLPEEVPDGAEVDPALGFPGAPLIAEDDDEDDE